MAEKTEFSRLVWKRTATSGTEPTIPSTETIDETWLDTDLKKGEGFVNIEDDRAWIRTNNGIRELALSGDGTVIDTTDATVTTILTIPVATSEMLWVEAVIIGLEDTIKTGITSVQQFSYRNDAGSLVNVGIDKTDNSEFTTAGVSVTTSGTNVLVRVTGEAATNIRWTAKFRYQSVSY